MARADIKAGRAYVELYVQKSAFLRGMNDARKQLNAFGDDMLSVGKKLAAFGATVAAGLTAATARFVSFGDQLDKASARTGIAASRLAALGFAAEQSGTSLETVEAAVRKMQRVITDASTGSKSAADALGMIGIAAKDIEGLKPDEQFTRITEALGAIEDPTKRAAVAMQIFGRSGTMLLPMLGSVEALAREAESLGIVPLDTDVKAAAALGDAFNRLKRTVLAVLFEIGAAIEPLVRQVVDFGIVFGATMVKFVRENREAIISAVKFGVQLGFLAASIIAVGVAAKLAAVGIGLFIALLSSPVALLATIAAVAAGTLAIAEFKDEVVSTFTLITDLVKAGEIETAFQVLVASLKVLWLEFTTFVPSVWNEAVRYIAKGIARLQGLLGYDSDGLIKIIDEDFDRSQKAILSDLTKAREDLTKLKNEALAKVAAAKTREETPAAEPAAPEPGEPPVPSTPKPPIELQASGARSIGSFSAAAFSAQSGGVLNELKLQYEATKKIAQQLIENQKQQHEDMQLQNRIIQQAGPVFS